MSEPNTTGSPEQEPDELQRETAHLADDRDAALDEAQRRTLIRLLRVTYPHPAFPDGPYERTATAISQADGAADVLASGLEDLNTQAGGDFTSLDDEAATAVVEAITGTALFTLVHSTAVVALYDDHQVWELLGYEGASFDKGGYLHRGFNDLDWLPEPRVEEYTEIPRTELVLDGEN